ncbi:MAG: BACON domain-containing protein [Prevotella sp.]|nr:BACON domain-containing protein [Prevotella sp.]
MAQKVIPWTAGSGTLTLDYTGQGSGTIAVSSSPNDLDVARSMQLTVAAAGITRQLTVTQRAAAPAYQPLTLDVLTAGTIAWLFYDAATHEPQEGGTAIEYRLNGGSWTSMPPGTTLQVAAGDRLEFRGSSSAYATLDSSWVSYHGFAGTATANASGHICSLIGGGSTIAADNTFYRLFTHAAVVSARDLILADNVTQHCYNSLFNGCTTLLTPPATLPATTLVSYCYSHMFNGCSSLATAPTLPATHLATYCYRQMFGSCTSLTTAPELPATTLASFCYRYMFTGCKALVNPPALPATTLATYCYYYMFYGCSALTTAPELPAKTLVSSCYYSMFKNCSSLQAIKVKCTTKPSATYSSGWLEGVAAAGTFTKTGSWSVTRSTSCVPAGWTVKTVSS